MNEPFSVIYNDKGYAVGIIGRIEALTANITELSSKIYELSKKLSEIYNGILLYDEDGLLQLQEKMNNELHLIVSSEVMIREKQKFKLDFSKPIIKHQVENRKPKHLIKKVIH